MGLEKVTYVDGTTVITAQNLNAIQDSIIDLEASRTVPTNVRNAIYTLLENAAYATTGLEDEIAIVEAWAEEVTSLTLSVSTLSLNNDVPQVITATTVPSGATVTWSSSNNSVATVSDGIVTGVSNGSCTITASAGDLSATCDVTVSGFVELVSISAVYTQSGTVYDTDSVDSLKADLVVTATYSDSSTETIPSTDYTLSGTLTAGTSTIYVVYGGKTTTFNVTVTHGVWLFKDGDECTSVTGGWDTTGFNTGQGSPSALNDGTNLSITFSATASAGVARSLSTKNKIDFSSYSKIVFILSASASGGTTNAWMYYPTSLSDASTQNGAYGSNYSSRRLILISQGDDTPAMDGTEKTIEQSISISDNSYISINYNCFNTGGNWSAPTWVKVRGIYLYS